MLNLQPFMISALLTLSLAAIGQGAAKKGELPTGSVTGLVTCADTNAPARLAQVILVPVGDGSPGHQKMATTDLDGRFAFSHVAEGRYYLFAQQSGYVDLSGKLLGRGFASIAQADREEMDKHLALVTVSAKGPSEISFRMERAGEIDGTVLYDDGSPAVSIQVGLIAKKGLTDPAGKDAASTSAMGRFLGSESSSQTDDQGRFRILGVPAGEYLVGAQVPANSARSVSSNGFVRMVDSSWLGGLTVYAGDTMRASKAKAVKIGAASERESVDITIPLGKLHTVRGHVILKSTGQESAAAYVQLLYSDTRDVARTAIVAGGEFNLFYVPEDAFVLVAGASLEALPDFDVDSEDGIGAVAGGTGFLFQPISSDHKAGDKGEGTMEMPLLVTGDMDGITVTVPDPPAKPALKPSEPVNSDVIQKIEP